MNFPITVTNKGYLTTTFTISATLASWFDMSGIPFIVTLVPSETMTFDVFVNIPVSAQGGESQELTIFVTPDESLPMADAINIIVHAGLDAWFTASGINGLTPLTVSFTDLSIGDINSRFWDFGDGFTSTLQNPTHTYTTPGTYTVSLTVTGPYGDDTYIRTNLVRVRPHLIYLPFVQR
jgi:PKD repeat protein